jgi:3'-phosphoadenosine 5'-phosphosulfate sulfotransferase (PAPS reductase)/FAD synthetase
MITTITKVESPKISKDNHSGGWYHNGTKIEYFVEYNKETIPLPNILDYREFTSQTIRDWFHGNIEMTVLMAAELGSNSLVGDLQAYLQVNKQYEAALNNPPQIVRNTHYDNPYNANLARMQGNTISNAILKHRKNG